MQIKILAVLLGALGMAQIAGGIRESSAPDCGQKCWANSKFVSNCTNEIKCFCEDADFQSAVYQCLYSQCQTTVFGSALHYALAQCPTYGLDKETIAPPLIRQHLRKRQTHHAGYASGHGSISARHSVYRRAGNALGSAYAQPTRTAGKATANIAYDGKPQPTITKSPSASVAADHTDSLYDFPNTI